MKIKLMIHYVLGVVIVLFISYFVFIGMNLWILNKGFKLSDNYYNLEFSPTEIMEEYKTSFINQDLSLNQEELQSLSDQNIVVALLDQSNQIIYQNSSVYSDYFKTMSVSEILYLVNSTSTRWEIGVTTYVTDFEYQDQAYTLLIGFPVNQVNTYSIYITNEWINFYLIMIIILFVIIIIVAFIISRNQSKPLLYMVDQIRHLRHGNYHIKTSRKNGLYEELNQELIGLSIQLVEVEEQRAQLEKDKEEWIANIAHDLKTPLSTISGYGQLINRYTKEEDSLNYSALLLEKTGYMERLINDLNLFYQLKNGQVKINKERINLVESVRSLVIGVLNDPMYQKRNIEFVCEKEKIEIESDAIFLTRALMNFIMNSLLHNAEDTNLIVCIEEENLLARIRIKDNGEGINQKELEDIFDRYHRSNSNHMQGEGTGLGMAISRDLIELLEGKLVIDTIESKGTEVIVEFKLD